MATWDHLSEWSGKRNFGPSPPLPGGQWKRNEAVGYIEYIRPRLGLPNALLGTYHAYHFTKFYWTDEKTGAENSITRNALVAAYVSVVKLWQEYYDKAIDLYLSSTNIDNQIESLQMEAKAKELYQQAVFLGSTGLYLADHLEYFHKLEKRGKLPTRWQRSYTKINMNFFYATGAKFLGTDFPFVVASVVNAEEYDDYPPVVAEAVALHERLSTDTSLAPYATVFKRYPGARRQWQQCIPEWAADPYFCGIPCF